MTKNQYGTYMTINEYSAIDTLIEIRHQITKGQKKFTVHAYGSDRRQLISMLDRQQCRFAVDGKTIYINYK
jgi:IS1 family transposase